MPFSLQRYLKKDSGTGVLLIFLKNTFCTEHLRATDFSEYLYPKQYIATENKNIQKEAVKSKKD